MPSSSAPPTLPPADLALRRAALTAAAASAFLAPFTGSSINVALPTLGADFGLDAVDLNWVATVYLLATAIFLVPMGRLADIYGRKRVFALGVAIFTLASGACALAPNGPTLIALRVVQGIGSAMNFGTGLAILSSVFPAGERGKVLGITVFFTYLGLVAGPVVGGLLTQHLGWRAVFLVVVPFGALAYSLVQFRLHGDWAGARGEPFDKTGALLYGVTLLLGMLGLARVPQLLGFAGMGLSALALVVFVWWVGRTASPVLDLRLFRENRVFALSNLAAFIHYAATFGAGFFLSLYLQYVRGMGPQDAGLVMLPQPIVMALCSPFAGRLSDKVEPRLVATSGMLLTAVGLAMLTTLSSETSMPFLMTCLALLGGGFALFSSPNSNAVMSSVDPRSLGLASALLGTMRLVGQMVSMGLAMFVVSTFVGAVKIAPQHHDQLLQATHVAFLVMTVMSLVGMAASMARGRMHAGPDDLSRS
jgi:EmrB/QacA subfamily drug resistance transporter